MFKCHLIEKYNITFNLTDFYPENLIWLNYLIVPEEYCKKGIGTKVMKYFCQYLNKNHLNCRVLACDCYGTPLNKLIKFYSKFGFKVYKEKKTGVYLERINFDNIKRSE